MQRFLTCSQRNVPRNLTLSRPNVYTDFTLD